MESNINSDIIYPIDDTTRYVKPVIVSTLVTSDVDVHYKHYNTQGACDIHDCTCYAYMKLSKAQLKQQQYNIHNHIDNQHNDGDGICKRCNHASIYHQLSIELHRIPKPAVATAAQPIVPTTNNISDEITTNAVLPCTVEQCECKRLIEHNAVNTTLINTTCTATQSIEPVLLCRNCKHGSMYHYKQTKQQKQASALASKKNAKK